LKQAFQQMGRASSSWPDELSWVVIDVDSLVPPSNKPTSNPLLNKVSHGSDIAFLQYTSGSTSDPKGVMITHANLFDNLNKIIQELQAGPDTVVVSWLPQYHDMGLIGAYLGTIFCGGRGFYMSPLTFLQRPMIWIEAVSRFHATHLQAPNFAFKLTARKFDPRVYGDSCEFKLDLSSVRHIINAAEPVTEESIDVFTQAFQPFGLKPNVMFPTYGLAEHTVFVCSGGKQRLTVSKDALEMQGVVQVVDVKSTESSSTTLIGCGFPSNQGVDVRIVDPENFNEKMEDHVGEIWINSNSKAAGYYNMADETQKDFFATMKNDQTVQYLRSGDLGFMHHGELFICGRIKDLIIIGGRNYYPQDIEATAEACSEQLRPGCSAAFTVDPISGDSEQVALIAELREIPEVGWALVF
jgi:acyl-CoA synthetase (AMP-forming)/AMP-acid ligase II